MEPYDYSSQANILRILNNIPIFSGIGIHEQHLLADKCVFVERKAEEIVIEQGDMGDCLYFIVQGSVLVSRKIDSRGWVRVNTLGVGEVFGEIALLRNIPRTARITTLTPCTFLTVNAHDFLEIYQYFPPQSRDNIQLVVAKRLQQLADMGLHVHS